MSLNLVERFAAICRLHPQAIAIDAGREQITYYALYRRASSIAEALRSSGSIPGDIVVVLTGDRVALVGAALGVMAAGCAFTLLDSGAPAALLQQRIAWLRPRFLLTGSDSKLLQGELLAVLEEGCCVIDLSALASAQQASTMRTAGIPPSSPAYICFTSGSQGQPKAIAGSLPALSRRINWEIATFAIDSSTRVSQLIMPTFDPWLRDVFVPLSVGGTLCIPPEPPFLLDPERLLEWLRLRRIRIIHCGPTLLSSLLSTPARIRELPDLQVLLLAGETLHVSTVKKWRRRFGKRTQLINLFGSTEATMVQLSHRVENQDLARGFIPIGSPLPDIDILLLDSAGKICTEGEAGELHVGGPTLSLGYLHNKAATESAFVQVGDDAGSGQIYYRTGDLASEFSPGQYRFLGRIDDQVKIRGVKVAPREIEDVLNGYPLVAACAVVAREDSAGNTALVACIEPDTEYSPAIPEMRAYLRQQLSIEAVPARFVIHEKLPLTENGKIDRRRLPLAAEIEADPGGKPVAAATAMEKQLANYWADVLGLEQVGVRDNFLDLGGHSLSAIQIVTRVRSQLGLMITLKEFFDHPTIAEQANRLQQYQVGAVNAASEAAILPGAGRAFTDTGIAPGKARHPAFSCPSSPSALFGKCRCNLFLVAEPNAIESFQRTADFLKTFDPAIRTTVLSNTGCPPTKLPDQPSLFFSPSLLKKRPKAATRIFCGYPLSKSEEYAVLASAGIAVPRWTLLEADSPADVRGFGDYLVRKPDYGAKGAEVRIVKKNRVRWKPISTSAAGPSPGLLLQEFIYTGPWPVSYRVNTLFGQVLYAVRLTGNKNRPVLNGARDFAARGNGNSVSIVSNARDSVADFLFDSDIISLGERAARAFPDFPMLGVDILKDATTGELFVIEVNALGHNWNFTREFQASIGLDIEKQFDGLRKAAYILAEETQKAVLAG